MRRLIQFVAIIALVIPTASCVSTPGRAGISLGGCQPRARTSSGRYQDRTRLHDEYRSVLAPAPQALVVDTADAAALLLTGNSAPLIPIINPEPIPGLMQHPLTDPDHDLYGGQSFARVAVGTTAGGILGGLALGALAAAVTTDSGGLISEQAVAGMFGAALGYSVGAGIGAGRAAQVPGREHPSAPGTILVSMGSAVLAGLAMSGLDQASDNPDTPWELIAGVGFTLHMGLTSWWAQRAGRNAPVIEAGG